MGSTYGRGNRAIRYPATARPIANGMITRINAGQGIDDCNAFDR